MAPCGMSSTLKMARGRKLWPWPWPRRPHGLGVYIGLYPSSLLCVRNRICDRFCVCVTEVFKLLCVLNDCIALLPVCVGCSVSGTLPFRIWVSEYFFLVPAQAVVLDKRAKTGCCCCCCCCCCSFVCSMSLSFTGGLMITHRRSVPKRGVCFLRRLFVCQCACECVCLFVCPPDNFRMTKHTTIKLGG